MDAPNGGRNVNKRKTGLLRGKRRRNFGIFHEFFLKNQLFVIILRDVRAFLAKITNLSRYGGGVCRLV